MKIPSYKGDERQGKKCGMAVWLAWLQGRKSGWRIRLGSSALENTWLTWATEAYNRKVV